MSTNKKYISFKVGALNPLAYEPLKIKYLVALYLIWRDGITGANLNPLPRKWGNGFLPNWLLYMNRSEGLIWSFVDGL